MLTPYGYGEITLVKPFKGGLGGLEAGSCIPQITE